MRTFTLTDDEHEALVAALDEYLNDDGLDDDDEDREVLEGVLRRLHGGT